MKRMIIIRDVAWRSLYLLGWTTNCFSLHSCNARAKDAVGIRNMFGSYGAFFNGIVAYHSLELCIGGVACHGLCFASKDSIVYFALGEALVAFADGLYHGHGQF